MVHLLVILFLKSINKIVKSLLMITPGQNPVGTNVTGQLNKRMDYFLLKKMKGG
jgi:hypothetical protein